MSWGTKETYIYFRDYTLSGLEADAASVRNGSCAWPASNFSSAIPNNSTSTDIFFHSLINQTVDQIRLTHAEGKYKELCEALAVALNSDNNSMVVFADDFSQEYDFLSIKLGVGITDVSITYDT